LVARAILAVERLLAQRGSPLPGAAFTGSNVTARIERLLLEPGDEDCGAGGGPLGVALLATLVAMGLTPLHHLTETALHLLLAR
jgi:hypothetical protein